uniref:Laminin G domain-containing protein n=1 Tax=Petromyzon marinus TaxID=7757 RepID=S4RLG3_PETMA
GGKFPRDFSILTTLRTRPSLRAFLLAMYSSSSVQQLGLEVGPSPALLYEDQSGRPPPEDQPTFQEGPLINDGKWHRVAFSVEGKRVSLYVDCKLVGTQRLGRGSSPRLDTRGIMVFGTRILDDDVYEGDIQQLLIVSDPMAAKDQCTHFSPLCPSTQPNSKPHSLQAQEPEV